MSQLLDAFGVEARPHCSCRPPQTCQCLRNPPV